MDSSKNNNNMKKKNDSSSSPRKDPPARHRPDEDKADSSSSSRSSIKSGNARKDSFVVAAVESSQDSNKNAKQQAKAAAVRAGIYRKPAPPGSTASAAAASSTTASGTTATARAISDAQAKARGRKPNVRPKRTIQSPPHGLKSRTSSSSSSNATKLQRLQEEVAAKERGKPSTNSAVQRRPPLQSQSTSSSSIGSSLSAVKQLNRMEADIASKERARAGRGSGAKRTGTTNNNNKTTTASTSTNRLDRMEAEIAAKAKVGRASAALKKSNGQNRNEALAKKLQKSRATPATTPGAVSSTRTNGSAQDIKKKKKKDAATERNATYVGATSKDKMKKNGSKNYRPNGDSNHDLEVDILPPSGSSDEGLDGNDRGKINKGLAVAVAVEADDDVFIPAAVEYDPDAKHPVYKNQRFRVYSLLACTILIIIAACSITVLTVLEKNQAEADKIPTQAPTCARCSADFIEFIELEVGSKKLANTSSPEYMAKEWIIHEDELQLMPTDKAFIQRYLLAAFYFDTHQVKEWRSCNRQNPSKNETEDCELLKVTGIRPMTFQAFDANRWLSSVDECTWAGVICDDANQVRRVDLHGQGIEGTLPTSFARFPFVQTLSLQLNNFTGTLPEEYGKLKHMIHIELHRNKLTGTFPASWSNIRNLQQLNLAENQLTGQLPTDIGNLRTIKGLYLYGNKFSGTLAPEIANASSLSYFRLQKNRFTGSIPPEFGNMQLTELWLQNNYEFTGTLPPELGKLSNVLTDLRLSRTSIEGEIPPEMFELSQLWRLDVQACKLSGSISPNITNLGNLQILNVQHNQLTGSLPSEMGTLTNLVDVNLEGNQFTGSVPQSMCSLKENHRLRFISINCRSALESPDLTPNNTCDCCDFCCDSMGMQCQCPP